MTSAARMASTAATSASSLTEDWGPGPPPPVFEVPPPPIPPFMLPDLDKEDEENYCQSPLDSHLAVCDTTFVSNLVKSSLEFKGDVTFTKSQRQLKAHNSDLSLIIGCFKNILRQFFGNFLVRFCNL